MSKNGMFSGFSLVVTLTIFRMANNKKQNCDIVELRQICHTANKLLLTVAVMTGK